MPYVLQEKLAQATTNTYASLLKAKILPRTDGSIVLYNSHATAALRWKVLVSNDVEGAANTWGEEKAEATLAALTPIRYVLTGPFIWVDVQVASNVTDTPSEANCWLQACGE